MGISWLKMWAKPHMYSTIWFEGEWLIMFIARMSWLTYYIRIKWWMKLWLSLHNQCYFGDESLKTNQCYSHQNKVSLENALKGQLWFKIV